MLVSIPSSSMVSEPMRVLGRIPPRGIMWNQEDMRTSAIRAQSGGNDA